MISLAQRHEAVWLGEGVSMERAARGRPVPIVVFRVIRGVALERGDRLVLRE
jgi:hypothetical protein